MYVIPPFNQPVVFRNGVGRTLRYESRKHAVKALGFNWLRYNLVNEFSTDYSWMPPRAEFEWICEEGDRRLSLSDFAAYRTKTRYTRASTWNGEGPVPGVYRPRKGRYYRRMQTMGERRKAIPIEDEPGPRPSRRANRLPNYWDDYPRSDLRNNNWKRFRKTQWKLVTNRKGKRSAVAGLPGLFDFVFDEVRPARKSRNVGKPAQAGHTVIQTLHTRSIVDLLARLVAGGWPIENPEP